MKISLWALFTIIAVFSPIRSYVIFRHSELKLVQPEKFCTSAKLERQKIQRYSSCSPFTLVSESHDKSFPLTTKFWTLNQKVNRSFRTLLSRILNTLRLKLKETVIALFLISVTLFGKPNSAISKLHNSPSTVQHVYHRPTVSEKFKMLLNAPSVGEQFSTNKLKHIANEKQTTISEPSLVKIDHTMQTTQSTNVRESHSRKRQTDLNKPSITLEQNQKTSQIKKIHSASSSTPIDTIVLEVEELDSAEDIEPIRVAQRSWNSLSNSLQGAKLDSLILLIATSLVIPVFKKFNTSPIVGFMLTGTLLGPTGLNWVKDVHMIDTLGELGIVFFLFEMGLELSLEKLKKMRKDVFGLGTSQFLITAAVGTFIAVQCGLSVAAAITIGGSLALSSSAFVLQLLKDKDAMGTRYAKASLGILLLQDLAVVPLLVIVELLGKGGHGLGKALTIAGMKAVVSLSAMSVIGRRLLDPIFSLVAKSNSHEAFLSIIFTTVLLMSFVTQGIGLSDTLGAFLAGLLLAETRYRYQIEADIAPFRGLLLGFFFITVGFSIDLTLVFHEAPRIGIMLIAMIFGKASIITALSYAFGVPLASALQCGLLNSQAGEFAFVAFQIAERMGLISEYLSKLLLTTVALSMASTPVLGLIGEKISNRMERNQGLKHYSVQDSSVAEVKSDYLPKEFVVVCGYGRVGKMICDMLDRKFVKYIVLENSPQRAMDARNKGLPVFFGDINRPDILKAFKAESALACIITLDGMSETNRAVTNLRKSFPTLPIVARAKDVNHRKRLESMFDDVYAMAPVITEDSLLLTLPFGGAVLEKIGVSGPEIDAILEDFRRIYIEEKESKLFGAGGGDAFKFLDMMRKKPSSTNSKEEMKEMKETMNETMKEAKDKEVRDDHEPLVTSTKIEDFSGMNPMEGMIEMNESSSSNEQRWTDSIEVDPENYSLLEKVINDMNIRKQQQQPVIRSVDSPMSSVLLIDNENRVMQDHFNEEDKKSFEKRNDDATPSFELSSNLILGRDQTTALPSQPNMSDGLQKVPILEAPLFTIQSDEMESK